LSAASGFRSFSIFVVLRASNVRAATVALAETMAEVEDAPPQDAAEGGTSSGGKKGRYRREKPWVRFDSRRATRAIPCRRLVRRRCLENASIGSSPTSRSLAVPV